MHPSVSYLVTFLPSKANLVFSKKIDSRLHGNSISRLLLYRRQAAVILAAHPSSFSYRNMKWMPIIFQFVFASRLQVLEPMLHSSGWKSRSTVIYKLSNPLKLKSFRLRLSYFVRRHSITTYTDFWPFLTTQPPLVDSLFTKAYLLL